MEPLQPCNDYNLAPDQDGLAHLVEGQIPMGLDHPARPVNQYGERVNKMDWWKP
jgi:hypothetical protein